MSSACSQPLDARELEIYVKLEMSPMEANQTATKNAAEAL
jgi:imidazolonepropionase-like amidohydrolase